MIYPWQQSEWKRLQQLKAAARLPHALLLTGQQGIGKWACAQAFVRSLLCQANCDKTNDCHDCRLLAAMTHPNVLILQPEGKSQTIKIEQVRAVIEFVAHSSLAGRMRIVIIQAADSMNHHAANALLKTLEEPAAEAMLILLAAQPGLLPATILSRCQRMHFTTPNTALALAWLQQQGITENAQCLLAIAQGAPLRAKAFADPALQTIRKEVFAALSENKDILSHGAALADHDILLIFDFLISWTLDLIRLHLGAQQKYIVNTDYLSQLIMLKQQTRCQNSIAFLKQLQSYSQQFLSGIHLNKQLVLERLLILAASDREGYLC